jgi:hypothetical protein
MTDFAEIRRATVEIEGPREGSLEHRAALVLKVLAFINAAGVVLALFPPLTPVSTLLTLAFNAMAAALAGAYWLAAVGLDRRRPWAVAAVRPLLVLIAVSGVYSVLVGLGEGKLRIPFEVALAGWALLGPADIKPIARFERRSVVLVAAAALLLVLLAFGHRVFGWGGLLDVRETDLQGSIALDCGAPADGPPPTLTVSYDWSWSKATPVPSGIDIVVLGWTGADAEGRPLYIVGQIPENTSGIQAGREGYPSGPMAEQVGAESEGRYRWAIALAEQQHKAAHIEVELRLAREAPPEHATLVVKATYVHLGLWREDVSLTCSW